MRAPRDRAWAVFFCRAILGLIFFMAGVNKCFVMTPLGHARHFFVGPYADTFLPTWSLWATGTAVPLVKHIAVTFGHLLKMPLYEFHTHVIPRLALLTVVLLIPREDDAISVDGFLRSRRSRP
jgi:hypothetical protein